MLTDHVPHGDGLVAFGFLTELAKRGHEIHVLAPEIDILHPLPKNVVLHAYPKTAENDVFSYVVWMRKLFDRLDREHAFDLIHQLNPVNTGVAFGLIGVKRPIVLGNYVANWTESYDGNTGNHFARAYVLQPLRWVVQLMQQCVASKLLLTTRVARTRLSLPTLFENKICYVHHGSDMEVFAPAQLRYNEPEKPTILFFANMVRRKGIYTLIDAFDTVIAKVPDAELIVAGDGFEAEAVRRTIKARPWANRVRFFGNLARHDVARLMDQATVYCLPSYGEPYGMTAVEAMACAKMLVVTNTSGLSELPRAAGSRQVPPKDAKALASALVEILQLPREQRAELGWENRAYAIENFGWESVVDGLESVYRSMKAP